ncbi:hypothetical protein L873DRAFT_1242152 [Choiromyces venosus 120613-1]|uniref:Uncharacterized protein n=1 Tax=Choiromyces venosus 120613-1 TaxID=1336337 RepID=A0A3N4JGY0_9PEZI|nr:hypothetical protein L873DRAFT_1242152 [Choiromyces venosus 120613-1]
MASKSLFLPLVFCPWACSPLFLPIDTASTALSGHLHTPVPSVYLLSFSFLSLTLVFWLGHG